MYFSCNVLKNLAKRASTVKPISNNSKYTTLETYSNMDNNLLNDHALNAIVLYLFCFVCIFGVNITLIDP